LSIRTETISKNLHLTLQVTDVLAVAIKELRSNSSNRQNVVEWGVGAL